MKNYILLSIITVLLGLAACKKETSEKPAVVKDAVAQSPSNGNNVESMTSSFFSDNGGNWKVQIVEGGSESQSNHFVYTLPFSETVEQSFTVHCQGQIIDTSFQYINMIWERYHLKFWNNGNIKQKFRVIDYDPGSHTIYNCNFPQLNTFILNDEWNGSWTYSLADNTLQWTYPVNNTANGYPAFEKIEGTVEITDPDNFVVTGTKSYLTDDPNTSTGSIPYKLTIQRNTE